MAEIVIPYVPEHMTLREAVAKTRQKAKGLGHGKIRNDGMDEGTIRLMCEACQSTCYITHSDNKEFAWLPSDCGLYVRCGE